MNDRTTVLEGLNIQTSLELIRLGISPNDVVLTPAEGEIFTQLIGMARGMMGLKQMPPYIQSTPFRAYFDNEDVILVRKGQKGNGLKLPLKDSDRAIRAANIAIEMYKDAQIHRGNMGAMPSGSMGEVHDPGFDGLD